MTEYDQLQHRLAQGWNTWNTCSVLSHVLLPEGFALNLGIREYVGRKYLKEALIGRQKAEEEHIHPGAHADDGSYSELNLKWQGIELLIQSAVEGEDLVLLVTPLSLHPNTRKAPLLVVESGILWNRPGFVERLGERLEGHFEQRTIVVYGSKASIPDAHIQAQTPYLSMPLDGMVGVSSDFSTGKRRTLGEMQILVEKKRAEHLQKFKAYGDLAEVAKAIQTAVAWDTVFEPEHERILSPVSRIWNMGWGGYVLFEWDNYFAATMASISSRDLAYANAVEMTREITEEGLVPNFATVSGCSSRDRSEPPVGALVCRQLYQKFGDKWFLEEVFAPLLRWNRWWHEKRRLGDLLCWGSTPYDAVLGTGLEFEGVNERQGGAWESGLDNLPVYDDVPFDSQSHLLLIHDTGLNGLYVEDCEALADIALVLDKKVEYSELKERAGLYRKALASLWDDTTGIYRNRYTGSGKFSPRIAPTSFYPLLGKAATQGQAERLVKEHFYNPKEFWGEWIIPSISRDDPAYADQDYWRGRIWGPMNFLTYLSLKKYDLPQACQDMAEKSKALLLKEWLVKGHIHENYNGDTGEGCDKHNSDAFYHWGGLLGIIALIEEGKF
jgi:putative isomerase